MKKIPYSLLPFFFVTLFAVGCAKEDEATNDVTPYTINIKVGETYDLGEIGPWSAWNPFVATAWHNGKVTGQHVGECTVNCPYDERRFKFQVVTLKLYTSTICGRNCTYCGIVYMKNT